MIFAERTSLTSAMSPARSASGPPIVPLYAPTIASFWAGVATSSTNITTSHDAGVRTLPGMWTTSTMFSPDTSTSPIVPRSKW